MPVSVYTLDTHIIINALKGDQRTLLVLRDILADGAIPVYVSAIREIELLRFPRLSVDEAMLIENFLQKVSHASLDSQIAHTAATICRRYSVKLPDGAIAATALFNGIVNLSSSLCILLIV